MLSVKSNDYESWKTLKSTTFSWHNHTWHNDRITVMWKQKKKKRREEGNEKVISARILILGHRVLFFSLLLLLDAVN